MNSSEIVVDRKDLLSALRTLEIATRGKYSPELVISGERDLVTLMAGGSKCTISGKGFLFGQTRLPGKMVITLRQTLPVGREIVIGQEPDKIKFGSLSFLCTWETFDKGTIQIPINASLGQILGIFQHYTDEEIDKSGYRPKLEAANQERRNRIAKALSILTPLGVTQEDLETLVDEALIRLKKENFQDDDIS